MRSTFMMMLLLCSGVLLVSPVHAAITAEQFAYGLPVQVSGEQAFYELELPLVVYRESLRSDLGDIRVFNAAGQVVPHALRGPANQTLQQDVATFDLPFFPLAGNPDLQGDDLSIHVERTAEGTVIDVRAAGQAKAEEAGRVVSYLLDASGLKRRIDSLELTWPEDAPDFLAEVAIETSSDLVSWQRVTTAAVARLSHLGSRFDQNRIVLPRANQRYLRLSWLSDQSPIQLSRIRVLSQESYVVEQPVKNRLLLAAQSAGKNSYRFDLQGSLPISEVSIVLPEKNSLASMRLLSAATEKGPLQERWRGLVYNLANNGVQLATPPVKLAPQRHRFWELALGESESMPGAAPQLEFGWQPVRLVFLSRGEGPYLVAFGSNRVEPASSPLDTLIKSSGYDARKAFEPQRVLPGEARLLAGEAAQSGSPAIPWKEYSLWGVLLLGVLLIGGLSFSLYRKLRETDTDDRT